jgi:hypothetical protein
MYFFTTLADGFTTSSSVMKTILLGNKKPFVSLVPIQLPVGIISDKLLPQYHMLFIFLYYSVCQSLF